MNLSPPGTSFRKKGGEENPAASAHSCPDYKIRFDRLIYTLQYKWYLTERAPGEPDGVQYRTQLPLLNI